jgi:hypothetical protein
MQKIATAQHQQHRGRALAIARTPQQQEYCQQQRCQQKGRQHEQGHQHYQGLLQQQHRPKRSPGIADYSTRNKKDDCFINISNRRNASRGETHNFSLKFCYSTSKVKHCQSDSKGKLANDETKKFLVIIYVCDNDSIVKQYGGDEVEVHRYYKRLFQIFTDYVVFLIECPKTMTF